MEYPNVKKGINKIYVGEILTLMGAALAVVMVILLAVNHIDTKGTGAAFLQEIRASGMVIPFVVYAVGTLVLFLAGGILALAGIIQAAHDEESFKRALGVALLSIAVSIIGSFLQQKATGISKWIEIASTILTMMIALLVLGGIGEVARSLGNKEVEDAAQKTSKIVLYPFILSAVAEFLVAILNLNQSSVALFSVAIYVLDIVSYVVYIKALAKAKAMLE